MVGQRTPKDLKAELIFGFLDCCFLKRALESFNYSPKVTASHLEGFAT
jgi:hypothetical protein